MGAPEGREGGFYSRVTHYVQQEIVRSQRFKRSRLRPDLFGSYTQMLGEGSRVERVDVSKDGGTLITS